MLEPLKSTAASDVRVRWYRKQQEEEEPLGAYSVWDYKDGCLSVVHVRCPLAWAARCNGAADAAVADHVQDVEREEADASGQTVPTAACCICGRGSGSGGGDAGAAAKRQRRTTAAALGHQQVMSPCAPGLCVAVEPEGGECDGVHVAQHPHAPQLRLRTDRTSI